ncbi:MAG: MBL fold metallo-hydrolase [Oscillospiraceae bacterium]
MENGKFSVTFIEHSGFLVETSERFMLFDYNQGTLPAGLKKPLFIFVSHSHSDHFNRGVLRYGESFKNTRYILSDDIVIDRKLRERCNISDEQLDRTTFIPPDGHIELDGMRVDTLRSTDQGVAFIVECEGRRLYHAGDLNLWLWGDEDTREEAEEMTRAFKAEVRKLKGMELDIAFLPLDPRQTEEQYCLGMDYYARNVNIGHIFPMHMWGEYGVIDRMLNNPISTGYSDRIIKITKEGESFDV